MFVWSKLSSPKWEDAWEERFFSQGATNVLISQVAGGKTIRVEVFCEKEKEALAIRKLFGGSVREVKNQNWAALAPPPAKPILVRAALVVLPGNDPKQLAALRAQYPRRPVVSIPPAMAFGTGDHATTATCLRQLADIARELSDGGKKPWSLLDAGTGSGILAIAARKLGASPVAGFDFDDHAVKVARENAAANGEAETIAIDERDALKWKPKRSDQWDCITANLFATVLGGAFPAFHKALRPGGILVISGILREHAADCLAAGVKAGFQFDTIVRKGKWVTARGHREEGG